MTACVPVPGYEDLWPHVAKLHDPSSELHGEGIFPTRTLALMIAPSVEAFRAEWARQQAAVMVGTQDRFRFPSEWKRGARRRANELMARYNTEHDLEVLRGLHREHGVFPPEPLPSS